MATTNGGFATGATQNSSDVRRRNVPGYEKSNGDVTQLRSELQDDVKKSQKKVWYRYILAHLEDVANPTPRRPGRLRHSLMSRTAK